MYLSAKVGKAHVNNVYFNPTAYKTDQNATKQDMIDIMGETEGPKGYQAVQNRVKKVESEVRTVANSVYGPGTAKANSLYKEMIHTKSTFKNHLNKSPLSRLYM